MIFEFCFARSIAAHISVGFLMRNFRFTLSRMLEAVFVFLVLLGILTNPYIEVVVTRTEQCVWIVDDNRMPVYRMGFIDGYLKWGRAVTELPQSR